MVQLLQLHSGGLIYSTKLQPGSSMVEKRFTRHAISSPPSSLGIYALAVFAQKQESLAHLRDEEHAVNSFERFLIPFSFQPIYDLLIVSEVDGLVEPVDRANEDLYRALQFCSTITSA
jgi:hypothetical protein